MIGTAIPTAASYAVGRELLHAAQPAGSPGGFTVNNVSTGLSNGATLTAATYRTRHVAPNWAVGGLRAAYSNFRLTTAGEVDGANDVTVGVNVELGALSIPLTFGGRPDVTLAPGATVFSDPGGVDLAPGAVFFLRAFVRTAAAGQSWPLGRFMGSGEGSNRSDTAAGGADARAGVGPLANAVSYEAGVYPSAVVGRRDPAYSGPTVSVAVVGDSIATGSGENPYGAYAYGFVERALNAAGAAWSNSTKPGDLLANPATLAQRRRRMVHLAPFATSALIQAGVNDIFGGASLATMQSNAAALCMAFARSGARPFLTTITPKQNSGTDYTTTNAAYEAVRRQYNSWIRAGAGGSTAGFFEIADVVEPARNAGVWRNGYTADGTHPTSAAHALMAAALDPARLAG